MKPLTLLQLNSRVTHAVDDAFPEAVWLQAELSEVRVSRGHCYVEFVQHGNGPADIVAKARGQAWARAWNLLRFHFEQVTGQVMTAGMQVLVCVEPTFHTLYGYSLNIIDIDPTYTLGDIARRRQEILRTLEEEGVCDMNRELPLPTLLQRIAVVSSPTAAGYQDFCRQLQDNTHGLAFRLRLFDAVMQGSGVEPSVISALNAIAEHQEDYDCVVIIRGGGSTSDLSGFDTLALAEHVAQFPLPIITGIGHERDDTVIDMVAHTRVKTPTAAAEFILHHQLSLLDHLNAAAATLDNAIGRRLRLEQQRLAQATASLPVVATRICSNEAVRQQRLAARMATASTQLIARQQRLLNAVEDRLPIVTNALQERLRQHLALAVSRVESADPDRIMRLGYAIVRKDGQAVTSAAQLQPGDCITTTLHEGEISSVVS